MEKTDLPIITFMCNGIKLRMLLDTGCNNSIFNINKLDTKLKAAFVGYGEEVYGANGDKIGEADRVPVVRINIEFIDNIYPEEFRCIDISNIANTIKEDSGVEIDGILGTSFFKKYNYVIDFKEYVVYDLSNR